MKPIATVINNNQPGWTNIIETEPNVTLDVGTKLFVEDADDKPNEMYNMKLNETLHHQDGYSITRCPGGWIYRFYQPVTDITREGQWNTDYSETTQFVPYSEEFKK